MTAPTVTSLLTDITPFTSPPLPILAGDNLYIRGTHFDTATAVTVNGSSVPFSIIDSLHITVVVPGGLTSGPVVVVNPDGHSSSTHLVVVCQPSKWHDHPNLWWRVPTEAVTGVRNIHAFVAVLSNTDPDLATAWANSSATAENSANTHTPAESGTDYDDVDVLWTASEAFFSGDISGALTAGLDVSTLPTPPADAVSVRYENGDGHLTEIEGPFKVTVLVVGASASGRQYRVARLAGSYADGVSHTFDTFQVEWQPPGSYPAAVHEITTTDAMTVGNVPVTFRDTGLDTGHRYTYVVLPESTDGSGLVDNTDSITVQPVAGYLYMRAPRYRWIVPKPTVIPPLRQFPRDDFLEGAPRQSGSKSIQASARQGWSGTYR